MDQAPPSSPAVPSSAPAAPSVRDRVATVIGYIRPYIQADGGDLEFVDVSDAGVVSVRLHGACIGCPSATMTLKMGIERALRERVPEVTEVVAVSDDPAPQI